MKHCFKIVWLLCLFSTASVAQAQVFDIEEFFEDEEGPWSDVAATTITAPMVADGSITLDGKLSPDEYGMFEGINVTPGSPDGDIGNAWILSFAQSKEWEGADDSSFTYWVAHDSEFLYVGVDVLDDVVRSNDPNPQFWKDDAIEIIVDANNDRANVNTDQAGEFFNDYGGHNYFNYEGRFSRWDEDLEEPFIGWANAVDWSYGPEGEVYGFSEETANGWSLEVKFHKSQFEDENGGGPIEIGDRIGFNIGMDDDDGEDLAIQYWWANRARPLEFDALALDDGETIEDYPEDEFDWVIDAAGRLAHGGTGELIFGELVATLAGDFNGNGERDTDDLDLLSTAMGDNDLAFGLNGDGATNLADRVMWVEALSNTYMGDANFDGQFNSSDFVTVFGAAKYEKGEAATWGEGDWNGDGLFNSSDFVAAFSGGGYEQGERDGGLQTVPEPTSLVALLIAAGLLVGRVRRLR